MSETVSREALEQAYRQEKDANVSKRILLVLRTKYDGIPAAHVASKRASQTQIVDYHMAQAF